MPISPVAIVRRPFTGGKGGPGRLVEFVAADGRWQARRQWIYPIEPTGTRAGFDTICDDGENGLTELLALDNTRFLSLERSCLQNAATRVARNTGDLHFVDLAGADDISGVASLASVTAQPVAKTLLIDFDTLIPRLPASLANLDNFEGLAFGPRCRMAAARCWCCRTTTSERRRRRCCCSSGLSQRRTNRQKEKGRRQNRSRDTGYRTPDPGSDHHLVAHAADGQ